MTDPIEQKILDDIETHGCSVMSVAGPDADVPGFSYSIGIQAGCDAPEIILVGLRHPLAHRIINIYNDRVRGGEIFAPGTLYTGFLDDFPVYIEPVLVPNAHEYMRFCNWYYADKPFAAVQMIYPTTTGLWPWEDGASDWFKHNQPLLGRINPT